MPKFYCEKAAKGSIATVTGIPEESLENEHVLTYLEINPEEKREIAEILAEELHAEKIDLSSCNTAKDVVALAIV